MRTRAALLALGLVAMPPSEDYDASARGAMHVVCANQHGANIPRIRGFDLFVHPSSLGLVNAPPQVPVDIVPLRRVLEGAGRSIVEARRLGDLIRRGQPDAPPGDVYVNQGQGSPGQRYLAAWLRAGGQLTRSVEKMREEVATAEAAREEAAKRLRREGDAAEAARAAEAVRAAEAARIRGANAARDDRAKNRERANHRPGLRPRRSGPPS